MPAPLRVVLWNANGLLNHKLELQAFLDMHKIDIALISETHFTSRTVFKIPHYTIYHTIHPDNTAHGGAAIILRSSLRHYELLPHQSEAIQAATLPTRYPSLPPDDICRLLPSTPRHTYRRLYYVLPILGISIPDRRGLEREAYRLGSKTHYSKREEPPCRYLHYNCQHFSTGGPTYWPTDPNKLPDLLDFLVTRGLPTTDIQVVPVFELSSDHSAIIASIGAGLPHTAFAPTLATTHTNWDMFRAYIDEHINPRLRIKECEELDKETQYFTTLIQAAAWYSTPTPPRARTTSANNTPLYIRELIAEKRRSRGRWQRSRNQDDRLIYNRLRRKLQAALRNANNDSFAHYLTSLSPDDNSLWKATKRLRRPQVQIPQLRNADGSWAKSDDDKAQNLADHPRQVFTPHQLPTTTDATIPPFLDVPCQMSSKEVAKTIARTNVRKSPGYDRITGKVLKSYPRRL